jgi:predicted ester cyclase
VVAPGFTGKGRQGVRDFWALWNGAFPDNQVTVRTLEGSAGRAATESTFQGTHSGPLPAPDATTIPATGRPVAIAFASFCTVRDDLISGSTFYFDQLDMLGQLGLLPG